MKNLKHGQWVIKDWAGNVCFNGQQFNDFNDAEDFLSEELGDDYELDRQEYNIEIKN